MRKPIGDLGEAFAAGILERKGYRILARKYRCKAGEIDIIAMKEDCIFFIEVKTRQNVNFGRPAESVTWGKQQRIKKVAAYFAASQGYGRHNLSFQVMEVMVNQIENAF